MSNIKFIKKQIQECLTDFHNSENFKLKHFRSSHEYILNGVKLTSVTQFINSFEPPFNAPEIAEKVSKLESSQYYNLPIDFILQGWNARSVLGKNKHQQVEHFLKGTNLQDFSEKEWLIENNITPDSCLSEVALFNKKYLLGGICDIVQINEEENIYFIKVLDLKTSTGIIKDFDKHRTYSKQIILYTLMLKSILKDLILDKPFKILPGEIINIEPNINVKEAVNVHNMAQFTKPSIIPIIQNDYIKTELQENLKTRINN